MKGTKERGITLIVLIITIIIMLILVGVTISIVLGENGIIQKSKEARDSQTAAQNKEMSELGGSGIESKIDALVNGNRTQTISTKVTQSGSQTVYAYEIVGDGEGGIIIYNIGNVFYVDYDGNGTMYYCEPSNSEAIGAELAGALETILGINDISAATDKYEIFDGNAKVIKINNSWYYLDTHAGPHSDAIDCIAFTQTDAINTSMFENAVDFSTYVEPESNTDS